MPRKLSRPDTDLQKLANELGKRWSPPDGIAPWLRRNGPRLRRMVRDGGWTWADIGRAMTLAGITYGSGTPWTGTLLKVKMAQARGHLRVRDAKRVDGERSPSPLTPARAAANSQAGITLLVEPPEAPAVDGASEPEPTFALAALAPAGFVPAASDGAGGSKRPSPARKRVDVDDVIRRLQGGSTHQDSED